MENYKCGCEEMLKGKLAHTGQIFFCEMLKRAFLRDWFAGLAMANRIHSNPDMPIPSAVCGPLSKSDIDKPNTVGGRVAMECYMWADAMIKAGKNES